MNRKHKILILVIFFTFSFIVYQTITHKTEITKFIVKTILEHKKENAFEFANKFAYVVPNYVNKDGFEIVSKEDYEKYQQGYCLAENRILDKKELYGKTIQRYLDAYIEANKKILEFRKKEYWFYKPEYDVKYYMSPLINYDNYLDIVSNLKDRNLTLEKVFINDFNAIEINPKNYLKINLDDNSVGFSSPIIEIDGEDELLMLDREYIFKKGYFLINFIIWSNFNQEVSEYYHKTNGNDREIRFFDNCGNVKYDIEQMYLSNRELNGG